MLVHPQLPDFDVFEVLGVTPEDPPEAVKAAWRSRVKEHHPDAAGGSDEQIKRVNVAYEWLRDPTLRQTYLLATASRTRRPLRPAWDSEARSETQPNWPSEPDGPPPQTTYEGPRAASIEALGDRVGSASMDDLLDLVHGYRPDWRWSLGLAQGVEASGRRELGAAAVWQVRQHVRERLETLLTDPHVRAVYDDELVGHVVSDRLADLVRGIVMLDLLTAEARTRVTVEWSAVMGPTVEPPGGEPGLAQPSAGRSGLRARWSRVPESARWLLAIAAAGLFATTANILFPSHDALAVILVGFGLAAAIIAANRRPAP
jgi:hypothetical protein